MSEKNEHERKVEQGDPWPVVFEKTESGLRAFLRSRLAQQSDVDDCLQLVSLRVLENGASVKPAARRAWLFKVAANEAAKTWRKKVSTDRMLQRQGATPVMVDLDPTAKLEQEETQTELKRALERLPDQWNAIVRLKVVDNLTFQQIATELDIPLGTALTQMRRALEQLRQEIAKD